MIEEPIFSVLTGKGITVSGAGTSDFNGTYSPDATVNGKTSYVKVDGSTYYYIYYISVPDWGISCANVDVWAMGKGSTLPTSWTPSCFLGGPPSPQTAAINYVTNNSYYYLTNRTGSPVTSPIASGGKTRTYEAGYWITGGLGSTNSPSVY